MTRFDHLEFEEPQSQQSRPAQQVRQREPDHDQQYWLASASEERRNGLFESALRDYSRALELDKSLVAGWVGQVQMLIALDEYPEAELWARKALELFRNNADLLAGRTQALTRMGDMKAAQASCDAAIGQQGLGSYPWISRGELMLALREGIEEYCFDKAISLDDDWLVPLEIGLIYQHYKKTAKALARTRQAVERAPDRAHCWYRQGVCELEMGLSGPAKRSFEHCLQLNPKHAEARRALTELWASRKPVRRFLRRLFNRG
jgi:tetratricopeptide (TPR) repeat protein